MVPAPTDCVMTPGNVWVQWPDEMDKSYPYRMGFSGKMDFEMAKAGIGGQYQPITLPVLVISKPRADEKTNDVIAEHPFVVGDRVKVVVGLEDLREMSALPYQDRFSDIEKRLMQGCRSFYADHF
jgi:hypothetical protein